MKKIVSIIIIFVLLLVGLYFGVQKYHNYLYTKIIKSINVEASNEESCKAIAYGHRACGGPEGFLIYSTETTNENKLKRMIDRYNFLDEKFSSVTSICSIELEPKMKLVEGKCVKDFDYLGN